MKTERKSRGYEETAVIKQLSKKADIRITGKQIQEVKGGKGDVGIKSRGKIDFLTKYCGYVYMQVSKF